MKEIVAAQDVRIGMFVSELDRPWLESPLLLQGFLVEDQATLDQLRSVCRFVYVDRARSAGDAWRAPAPDGCRRAGARGVDGVLPSVFRSTPSSDGFLCAAAFAARHQPRAGGGWRRQCVGALVPYLPALIELPPPPPVELPEPPKVEVVEEVEAPPAPPDLVAPDIEVLPEEIPIVAPLADPVPIPEPIPVAPSPSAVSQPRSAPRLIAGDKPDYPSAARRAGEQGTTELQMCVGSNGRVTSVSVARSSGSSRLDDAAAKWIRGERFQPAKINGVASDVCGHAVAYEWSLRDA